MAHRWLAALFCIALATQGLARPPLRDVGKIDNGLMVIAIADDLRKRCPDINARFLRALSVLQDLKSDARRLGYSREEVERHVTSSQEKSRMRDKALAWLSAQGVDAGDTAGFCAFGKRQIDAGTAIGRLLY